MSAAANSLLPLLVVFGLDHTLWPFNVDVEIVFPLNITSNGSIYDNIDQPVIYYPDVPKIFKKLRDLKIPIAVTSLVADPNCTLHVLNLLGLRQQIDYLDFESPFKKEQLNAIQKRSRIAFSDFLFFDDWQENIRIASEMGVLSIFAEDGMTMEIFEDGLKQFAAKRANITSALKS